MTTEFELTPLAHQLPRAAQISGLSRSTLYHLIKTGELRIIKVGRRTLIADDDLRSLIARHRVGEAVHGSASSRASEVA